MEYIEVKNLQKQFTVRKKREHLKLFREKTAVRALNHISFTVSRGELVGYIGPNGAGKSTTVKILSGILKPDGGSVYVDGRIPWRERKEHVGRIGVVFGQRTQLWWDVPLMDSFELLKEIYHVPEASFRRRLEELTGSLSLGDLLRTPLRLLSLGQRMRAELCGSLLHSPSLLFLDEPTIGLDAVSKLALRDFLKKENADYGTTVLLTTHDMEDIAALCSRVMVLGHGSLLYNGSLQNLLSGYDTEHILTVRYMSKSANPVLPENCMAEWAGESLRITYVPAKFPTTDLIAILQSAGPIRELTAQPQNIDHMIAAMYQEMGL